MESRIVAIFAISLLLFTIIEGRLMVLGTNVKYDEAARKQSEFILQLGSNRGNIYDKDFNKLTNNKKMTKALVSAGSSVYLDSFSKVPDEKRSDLYDSSRRYKPFLIEVNSSTNIDKEYLFDTTTRYSTLTVAPHLLGYLDGDGKGCYGAEYAYETIIKSSAPLQYVNCTADANGGIIGTSEPVLTYTDSTDKGIMLTLDTSLQRICEGIAYEMLDKGSIVVMECKTGRIRASVSMPTLNPNNIAESLNDVNTPFINRSIAQFNVGSVFKPLIVAAALDNAYDKEELYECTGAIDVDGHVFKCAYSKGHGSVNMQKALVQSCNCYFVQLGLRLGGENIYKYARDAGFGEATAYMGNTQTAKGNLPNINTLANTGQLASISFGQGELMASPVQMAAFMNVFANNGVYVEPSFVEGIVNETERNVDTSLYHPAQRMLYDKALADTVSEMLCAVVTEGLGSSAKPREFSAAGKTGTAQTGRRDINDNEMMNAWFVGYFPALEPKYTIAILLDDGMHDSDDACKIFAKIANNLSLFAIN